MNHFDNEITNCIDTITLINVQPPYHRDNDLVPLTPNPNRHQTKTDIKRHTHIPLNTTINHRSPFLRVLAAEFPFVWRPSDGESDKATVICKSAHLRPGMCPYILGEKWCVCARGFRRFFHSSCGAKP